MHGQEEQGDEGKRERIVAHGVVVRLSNQLSERHTGSERRCECQRGNAPQAPENNVDLRGAIRK